MRIFAILVLMISLQLSVSAQTAVDARQTSQRARITQGVRQGDLTKRETAGLAAQQRRIRKVERLAKSDGEYTGKEKVQINRMQRRASRNIAHKKNNDIGG